MIHNGLSIIKTDLLHHYVKGLVTIPQKHGNENQKFDKIMQFKLLYGHDHKQITKNIKAT